jgi:hypothetical protein
MCKFRVKIKIKIKILQYRIKEDSLLLAKKNSTDRLLSNRNKCNR